MWTTKIEEFLLLSFIISCVFALIGGLAFITKGIILIPILLGFIIAYCIYKNDVDKELKKIKDSFKKEQ